MCDVTLEEIFGGPRMFLETAALQELTFEFVMGLGLFVKLLLDFEI